MDISTLKILEKYNKKILYFLEEKQIVRYVKKNLGCLIENMSAKDVSETSMRIAPRIVIS